MTAREIAAALGNARPDGKDWRCRCPLCGHNNLTLCDNGGRLLVRCFSGCASRDVHKELRQRHLRGNGRANGNGNGNGNGAAAPETRTEHEAKAATAAARRTSRMDAALDVWRNSFPATDTMAETYLASRLLIGRVPPSLRYVPALWHQETGMRHPALIGLVEHENYGAVGIHAVFLNPLDASVRCAAEPRKKSFGPVGGGAVRLAAPAATLAVAEGIEDALAFMQASGIPTWAAITASGIRSLIPPPLAAITTIILIEDQDANDVGQRAVADAAGRLAKKGYEIKIARPIIGKDINESLLTLGLTETLFTLEDYERGGAAGDWYSRCLTGHNGQVLSNLANVLLAIREDPAWQSMFTRDALFETVLLAPQAATKSMALIGPEYPRPMIDEDITAVQERLQLAGLLHCNKQTVAQAIELVASANTFHPIKDYLEPLRWDGVERLDFWLTDCLGVERTEYAQAVGRLFLIAMVARIYEPGCQSDYMLILEGPQGRKKSSCCRALAGEWFSDNLPENVSSKDAALHLRGKWLVEVAELHTFNRSETAALKAFITRREDIFRPPYGHKEVYRPRQNLFIGTTNRKVYLQDPTGARRFWPVLTTEIDLELLTSQRDQLFAEALVRYRRGEKWWPDPDFEAEHMAPEQDARFEGDVWEELISGYLSCSRRTTVLSVAMNALSFAKHDVGTAEQRRIAAILEQLGWWRGKRTHGTRWWLPPDGDDGVPQGAAMPHQA